MSLTDEDKKWIGDRIDAAVAQIYGPRQPDPAAGAGTNVGAGGSSGGGAGGCAVYRSVAYGDSGATFAVQELTVDERLFRIERLLSGGGHAR